MPWSHHSHSGQFCGHAASKLEDIVLTAIEKRMSVLCLTEHMTRHRQDFYPEEEQTHDEASLAKLYDDFYVEARRLQKSYAGQIAIFVGFEGEWIRAESLQLIKDLLTKYPVDVWLGSMHHVHTYPIDYDHELYYKAREVAGGTDERIFEDYFDSQLSLLQALQPPLVGHFDLIRLKSDDPERSFKTWPGVWEKALRNLKYIAEYGGVLELNSSSLRKGMTEMYPQVEICQTFRDLGGRFTLSDDSHGVAQVGLNYAKTLACVEKAGITQLVRLNPADGSEKDEGQIPVVGVPQMRWTLVAVQDLRRHEFWQATA
ncbi:histidinol-phosphatase [Hortaea werneckii]|nr:histidinol-phosphatase [Hortaea werneckii]